MPDSGLLMIGLMLIVTGIIMIVMGYLVEASVRRSHYPGEESEGPKVSGGGVVIIGPIPIIFGSDKRAAIIAAVIGAVLTVIALVAFLLMNWGVWRP